MGIDTENRDPDYWREIIGDDWELGRVVYPDGTVILLDDYDLSHMWELDDLYGDDDTRTEDDRDLPRPSPDDPR